MKKPGLLLLLAIFICAPAFAQSHNEGSLDQDGDANSSTITQANSWESEANVKQEGDNNASTVKQDGYRHNASLYNVGDGNVIRQSQYGTNNHQRVELWGNQNEFTLFQEGEDNFAYLNARGTGPGLFGRPNNGGNNNSNVADIEQNGYKNLFSGSVTGSYNEVSVEQTGNHNKIGGSLFNGMPAFTSSSSSSGVWGFISSIFNGNAWSGNGVNIYGDNNEVNLKQIGDYNTNYAFVEGHDNKVVQRMTNGSDNTVLQAMMGSDNKSVLELWGDGNTLITGQQGSGNQLFLNARGTGSGFTNGGGNSSNLFVALQVHEDNMISAGIDGSYNEVGILQFGSHNAVGSGLYAVDGVRIEGNHNKVHIGQFGNGNTANSSIMGHNNVSTIKQY